MIVGILKYAGAAAFVYVLLISLMYVLQERLLFVPDTKYYSMADVGASAYDEVTAKTADGLALKGWYSAAQVGRKTIILFHGNASTWQWRARDFEGLASKGYGVLLAGYRGYGGNAGKPSEAGFYADGEAWIAYLQSLGVPMADIVPYGESLGSGVAVEMAYRHKNLGGLILETPYASIAETAAIHYPFVPFMSRLVRNKFENIYKVGAITVPKLVLIAGDDRTIPPAEGKRLYEYAAGPKIVRIFERAGHTDIRSMGGLVAVESFLDALNN